MSMKPVLPVSNGINCLLWFAFSTVSRSGSDVRWKTSSAVAGCATKGGLSHGRPVSQGWSRHRTGLMVTRLCEAPEETFSSGAFLIPLFGYLPTFSSGVSFWSKGVMTKVLFWVAAIFLSISM